MSTHPGYKGNAGRTRAITAVDGSLELAETLTDIRIHEGYGSTREFVLRTIEFRYPELKYLIDQECRPKQGRPRSRRTD